MRSSWKLIVYAYHAKLLPDQLLFAKFGVLSVLLHSGFDNVALSRFDVFFFASPLPTESFPEAGVVG